MNYLIVDLEATCADDGSIPRTEMEIIEIGAVMVESGRFTPLGEFQAFVRPLRHPRLTSFCERLTSIRQADVDAAATFPAVLERFARWFGAWPGTTLFCSWGAYDQRQLQQDCAWHGLDYPLPEHLNLKTAFSQHQGIRKDLGMKQALARVGLTLEGVHHRGIDDARNIARLLPYCVEAGE